MPSPPPAPGSPPGQIEVSFVMPCLNEAETIERCVRAARACIEQNHLAGEVIVADNGSTDGSPALAAAAGANVLSVPVRGIGAAITAAVRAARGRYVIMGDSDAQHDFSECMPFVERLRRGDCDLVMGSRLRGTIKPGAMRTLNRYVGNPILSLIGRILFHAPVSDFHCGLRAFNRESFLKLPIRTTGFEFTTEHIAKTALMGQRIAEVPITVYPEGRTRPPHLRPYRDGWRTLRFMLLLSPRWTLGIPALVLFLLGLALAAPVAVGPATIAGYHLDIHTLILGCMLILVGYSALSIAAAARIFAITSEIGPPGRYTRRVFSVFTLERGLAFGSLLVLSGAILVGILIYRALTSGLRADEVFMTLRPMVIGATLIALGAHTVMMSFFYSMLGIPSQGRQAEPPQP